MVEFGFRPDAGRVFRQAAAMGLANWVAELETRCRSQTLERRNVFEVGLVVKRFETRAGGVTAKRATCRESSCHEAPPSIPVP